MGSDPAISGVALKRNGRQYEYWTETERRAKAMVERKAEKRKEGLRNNIMNVTYNSISIQYVLVS